MRLAVLALVVAVGLAACGSPAAVPAFRPRTPSRMMTTASLRVVQNGSNIALIDRATGDRLPFSVDGELVGTLGDAALVLIEVEMRTRLAAYAHGQKVPFASDVLPFDIVENGCLLAVQAAPGEVRLGFGSSHSACDHGAQVTDWVAVDLRTAHARVLPRTLLAF